MEAIDTIQESLTKTIEENYIGKVPNSFDNKCLLMSDIQEFYTTLQRKEVLGEASVDIDIEENRAFLEEMGIHTSELTEEEIRKADTDDKVFLTSQIRIYDVMEEVSVKIEV